MDINLFTGLVALGGGMVGSFLTGLIQIKITNKNIKKDIDLQQERIYSEQQQKEISLERQKLEQLHQLLSKIAFENSQTMSHIKSFSIEDKQRGIFDFRQRYIDNNILIDNALSISDIYYPEFSGMIRDILGQANIFWGHQETLIRIKANEVGWTSSQNGMMEASKQIKKNVIEIQNGIKQRGLKLLKIANKNKAIDVR